MKKVLFFTALVSVTLTQYGFAETDGSLSQEEIIKMKEEVVSDPSFVFTRNALTRGRLGDVAVNWDRFAALNHTFSHKVDPELSVTDQKMSGRCWIFSALNMIRVPFVKKYDLGDFEFSQSYIFFYDKLEKANYFLENVIATHQEPVEGRVVSHLLTDPVCDGGQWDMFVNIAKKYGVVPKSVYPDSEACKNSRAINYILTLKLRQWCLDLRSMIENGATLEEVKEVKADMMTETYKICALHFGLPPSSFDWEYTDKNKEFHAHRNLTPKQFLEEFVDFPFEDMVSLIDSPRESTPYNKTFTVQYIGNVIEGQKIHFINVGTDLMKKASIESIKDNMPVWMGCDVGKSFHGKLGVMDTEFYNLEDVYHTTFDMDKAQRMDYRESTATHAMLFTGVNIVDGKPNRWRVENSWGDSLGDRGYFVMTDKWFDEYMFEVVVHKKYLPEKLLHLIDEEPEELPPWDPLASLAH